MKIAIVGSGYVGLCTAAGFASLCHDVTCIDVDKGKIEMINAGKAPIYEEGLDELLRKSIGKTLKASTNLTGSPDFIFIAVGTPSKEDGSINLGYIRQAAEDTGNFIKGVGYCVVVVKSTVLPGTTELVAGIIERISGKKAGRDFGVCMNPEFLREGQAMEDFFKPDRIVIGQIDKKSGDMLEQLYQNFSSKIIRTDLKTAELIKYASNAFLATKISFINEIGNICKQLGIDAYDVAEGMGLDKRISMHFLQAGVGFGGSCFGKDVSALLHMSKLACAESKILGTILEVNKEQPLRMISLLESKMEVSGKTVAILGLAFKEDTDDVRDAPSIIIIRKLLEIGCKLRCYDPKGAENMKKIFPNISYFDSAKDALRGVDACLILTGWKEFTKLRDEDFDVMRDKVVIEGRKILDRNKVTLAEGVCW